MVNKTSLGITFIPQYPPEQLVPFARKAEGAGLDSIWLYEDCFYAGGFTSAATILAATNAIQVGIGILPFAVRNPLFTAMEIATLARLYPGRFIPGLGHGFEPWMKQIGATTKSSLKALEETLTAVHRLLSGDEVTLLGSHVHLDRVKMQHMPAVQPPVYIGAVREKTLQLAGRSADGVCLSVLSSPRYVEWANKMIQAGEAETGSKHCLRCVTTLCNIEANGTAAREPIRHWLAQAIQNGGPHLIPAGMEEEVKTHFQKLDLEQGAFHMPDDWIDALSASGTPEQAAETVDKLVKAGADSVVLAPVDANPETLNNIIHELVPLLKNG